MRASDNVEADSKTPSLIAEFLKFFSVLFTGLAAVWLFYPFLKDLGFPRPEIIAQLHSFLINYAYPNNTVFLYVIDCAILFIIGLIYGSLALPRLAKHRLALSGECFISILFFLAAWGTGEKLNSVLLFLWRVFSSAIFSRWADSYRKKASLNNQTLEKFSIIICVVCFSWIVWALKSKVFCLAFPALSTFVLIKWLIFSVVFFMLFQYEKGLPKNVKLAVDAAFGLFISVLTFRNEVDYFNFANFLSVANDIQMGKDITVDTVSIYGIL